MHQVERGRNMSRAAIRRMIRTGIAAEAHESVESIEVGLTAQKLEREFWPDRHFHRDELRPEQIERLDALAKLANCDKWFAGMGGVASVNETNPPYQEPGSKPEEAQSLNVETPDYQNPQSLGVGLPLYDPDEAVANIEEDPAGKKEWWPQKK